MDKKLSFPVDKTLSKFKLFLVLSLLTKGFATAVLAKQGRHILVLEIGHCSVYFTLDIQQGAWTIRLVRSFDSLDVFIRTPEKKIQ